MQNHRWALRSQRKRTRRLICCWREQLPVRETVHKLHTVGKWNMGLKTWLKMSMLRKLVVILEVIINSLSKKQKLEKQNLPSWAHGLTSSLMWFGFETHTHTKTPVVERTVSFKLKQLAVLWVWADRRLCDDKTQHWLPVNVLLGHLVYFNK